MANGARTATRGAKRPRRMLDSSSSEGGSRDRKGLVCVCVFFPTRLFASAPRSVPAFQRVACDVGSIHGIFKALKPKWENQMEKEEDPELSSCVFGVHGIQSDSRLSLKRAEQSRV